MDDLEETAAGSAGDAELRESAEKLRGLIDQSVQGVVLIDDSGIVIEWNAFMADLTGIPSGEILRRPVGDLVGRITLDPPLLETSLARMRSAGSGYFAALSVQESGGILEARLVGPGGRDRFVRGRIFPMRVGSGLVIGVVVEDITVARTAEALLAESREQLDHLARRLIAVREDERRAVALEIHDELGQALTALKLDLRWLERNNPSGLPGVQERRRDAMDLVDRLVGVVQRMSTDLHPRMLDDLGLAATIEWLCRDFAGRTGLACKADTALAYEPRGRGAITLFRIVQEALTNVARHARATRVLVTLYSRDAGGIVAEVTDDGVGIEVAHLSNPQSTGLTGMRERAQSIGGAVTISRGPAGGTTVTVTAPP
jgi:two-component system, NarL family, sensor histidine kinase UhpB